jgi:hypothetical protein
VSHPRTTESSSLETLPYVINTSKYHKKIEKVTAYHFGLFLLDCRKVIKTRAFFLSTDYLLEILAEKSNIFMHEAVQ